MEPTPAIVAGTKSLDAPRTRLVDATCTPDMTRCGGHTEAMTPEDVELRNETYRLFVALGRSPSSDEVGAAAHLSSFDVREGWQRLHEEHALVLNSEGSEIRMANPFSAVPTAYRVRADGRWWYANCAWDAFGICAALHSDGRIEASCPDCGEPLAVDVVDQLPHESSLVFHCLVPAGRWWDDIVFT
ncbi:MAG TPA: organomercurial lyase [Homoserinimonas sp.]|nr:organomercurial lyase [Homoserinimonas sp.]